MCLWMFFGIHAPVGASTIGGAGRISFELCKFTSARQRGVIEARTEDGELKWELESYQEQLARHGRKRRLRSGVMELLAQVRPCHKRAVARQVVSTPHLVTHCAIWHRRTWGVQI